jgi:hypothetical protein
MAGSVTEQVHPRFASGLRVLPIYRAPGRSGPAKAEEDRGEYAVCYDPDRAEAGLALPGVDVLLIGDEPAQECMSTGGLARSRQRGNRAHAPAARASPAHRLAAFDEVPLRELENETAILL